MLQSHIVICVRCVMFWVRKHAEMSAVWCTICTQITDCVIPKGLCITSFMWQNKSALIRHKLISNLEL